MEPPKRVITAIVRVDGALRAQLDCGHLANVLARDLEALNRRVGTERYCYECATQGKEAQK